MSPKEFTQRILPFKDKLYRLSLRMMNNVAESEDIVQEVFIKLWKSRDNMDQYQNLEAWSMRMTKNLSIDRLRARKHAAVQMPEGIDFKANGKSPDQTAELNETMDQIHKFINALPKDQQVAIHLREIEGMTYKEIADFMDTNVNQVKTYIFRARKQLQKALLNVESYGL